MAWVSGKGRVGHATTLTVEEAGRCLYYVIAHRHPICEVHLCRCQGGSGCVLRVWELWHKTWHAEVGVSRVGNHPSLTHLGFAKSCPVQMRRCTSKVFENREGKMCSQTSPQPKCLPHWHCTSI